MGLVPAAQPRGPVTRAACVGLMLALAPVGGSAQMVVNYTASGTWFVPAGVTTVKVELWGGGGSGQRVCCNTIDPGQVPYYLTNGGGGSWGLAADVTVVPGTTCTITVGAAGGVPNPNPNYWDPVSNAGGTSSFDCGPHSQSYSVPGGLGSYTTAGQQGTLPSGPWDDRAGGNGSNPGRVYGTFGQGNSLGSSPPGNYNAKPGLVQLTYNKSSTCAQPAPGAGALGYWCVGNSTCLYGPQPDPSYRGGSLSTCQALCPKYECVLSAGGSKSCVQSAKGGTLAECNLLCGP